MPTYVYKFVDTGETIEVQQAFSDPTLTEFTHPTTGESMAVKKVFLPVGVTFKGDGFYKTDSRASSKKSTGSTGSTGSGGSDGAGKADATSPATTAGSSESSPSTPAAASTTS